MYRNSENQTAEKSVGNRTMAAAEMEVGGLGLEKLDTEIKNIHTQEVLGVRHVVPRTHVSHAILHENTSQDRYLRMKLEVKTRNGEGVGGKDTRSGGYSG